jgi:hypothetical protein
MAKRELASDLISKTAKFAFQSHVPSSSDSGNIVSREKIIIDNKSESSFKSNRKLKQKANE